MGDYKIVRPLGRGGMGDVYLGHDAALDRPVAIKTILAPDPHDEEMLKQGRSWKVRRTRGAEYRGYALPPEL